MTTKNFSINEDYCSLTYNGQHIDLHNNFNFQTFSYDQTLNKAECIFTKGVGDWVPRNSLSSLIIRFDKVKMVFSKEADNDYPIESLDDDNKCIDMIGFSYSDDEIMDGITDNHSSIELPSLLLVFVTGKAIKVLADSVEIVES